jgi:hypothetical protein
MYRPGFRRANTFWKAPGVHFHMHQTSGPYHVRAGHNHSFGLETFFANGGATLILAHWAMYRVESNSDAS